MELFLQLGDLHIQPRVCGTCQVPGTVLRLATPHNHKVKFNVYVSAFKSDETVSFGNPLHYALSALSIIWNNCKIRIVIQIWMSPSRKKEHVFFEDKNAIGSFLLRNKVGGNLLIYFLISRNTFSTKNLPFKIH